MVAMSLLVLGSLPVQGASVVVATDQAHAPVAEDAACVADFYRVAREEYGWTPAETLTQVDPALDITTVGELTQWVREGRIGVFDRAGEFHICPAP